MSFSTVRKRHGLKNAIVYMAFRCVQKCMVFDVTTILLADTNSTNAVDTVGEFEFRLLEANEVRQYARERQLDLEEHFADRLETGYDFCFGAFLCGQLVGYCFLALDSIEPEQNRSSHPKSGVGFSFGDDIAFRYKGFVHPPFRGQQIYPRLLNGAAAAMGQRGVRYILSTNEVINFSMRKCMQRMGYKIVGYAIACGFGNHIWVRVSNLSGFGIEWGSAAKIADRCAASEIETTSKFVRQATVS